MKFLPFLACCLIASSPASANTTDGKTTKSEATADTPHLSLELNPDVKLKFGGRLYLDWTSAFGDSSFDTDDGVEFRAARFYVAGTLYDLVDWKAQYDFAGGDTDFKDVYMAVKDVVGDADVKIGHFKEPFSLEEQTSSRFITFDERSLANAFTPGRNTGVMVSDGVGESGFGWAAGVFRASDAFGNSNDQSHADNPDQRDSEYSFTARVAGDLLPERDDVLHVGVAASYRQPNDGKVRFRSRPEAHLLSTVASSGSTLANDVILYGGELAWVHGPASVQGEYIMASVNAETSSNDADYAGYYVEGSYFLTGESRNYKKLKFDRVSPLENRTREGGRGAHQVAVRYSMLDLDDGPSNDQMSDITIGYNWYLNPHTVVKLNYVRSNFDDGSVDDDANIFILRFQIDW